jgi:fructose-specific phosphotransferase system IIA component
MKIHEILNINSISIGLRAYNKDELLSKMVDLAAKSGKIKDAIVARQEVIDRERLLSTGIGKGIALPHAKTDAVIDTVCSFAILANPIEYESLDGKPINCIFMLLGNDNDIGNHLRLLSKISKYLNINEFRNILLRSKTPDDALRCLMDIEVNDM